MSLGADFSSPLAMIEGDGSVRPNSDMLAAAVRHKLELLLLARLLDSEPTPLDHLRRGEAIVALEKAAADNLRLLHELFRVLDQLHGTGIPALPLKGPTLACLLWNDLRVRRCRDIDVLVSESDAARAIRVLEAAGYRRPPPSGRLVREVHLFHDSRGSIVDLHWNITFGEAPFPLEFSRVWADRGSLRWCGKDAPILGAEWLFVTGCIYLIKDYPWPELIYLSDIARLVSCSPDLDWEKVHAVASSTGTRRICAIGLELIDRLPGSAVPPAAKRLFPLDAAVLAGVSCLAWAARNDPTDDPTNPRNRLRKILAHPAFRERISDKAKTYISLAPLVLYPSRTDARQSWGQAVLERLARLLPDLGSAQSKLLRDVSPRFNGQFRLRPEAKFYPLDDAGILLSTGRRRLYGLSPSAAFLWCCLEGGLSPRTSIRRLSMASGRPNSELAPEARATLRSWRELGLLSTSPESPQEDKRSEQPALPHTVHRGGPPSELALRRRYRLLDTIFEVDFGEKGVLDTVDPALRHVATTRKATAFVSILSDRAGYRVLIDGEAADACRCLSELSPIMKGALGAAAVNRKNFALSVHAAMLSVEGRALLLPGKPGSGKTCLAAALSSTGLQYCADETTVLESTTFYAAGLCTSLAVKEAAWLLLQPIFPEIQHIASYQRVDGKIIKYLPPPYVMNGFERNTSYPVHWIIFPTYASAGPNKLSPVRHVEALGQLFADCPAIRFPMSTAGVQPLVDWISTTQCYSLSFNNLSAAVRLVKQAVSPGR
jgi:hypothetical protein